eukprot:TRINITY_DN10935_c0_g1_i2.p1 TRINITY_DN10935_c0_g1~~TRINITY_DN10935_c0_g1_i2.p1  ORF type:complete len:293 (-),score=47.01 TRINITY_DN10935_c0_g1_i2:475-1353(-)
MRLDYDVAVVGAGLVGSAAARHISEDGRCTVVLIGPQHSSVLSSTQPLPLCTSQMSGNGGKHTVYSSSNDVARIARTLDTDTEWTRMAIEAMSRYRDLERESGLVFFSPRPCVVAAPRGHERIHAMAENARKFQQTFEILSGLECSARWPMIHLPNDYVALVMEGGIINPKVMIEAQKRCAIKEGCAIKDDVCVGFEEHHDHVMVRLESHPCPLKVGQLLIATNASFDQFCSSVSVTVQPCEETVVLCQAANKRDEHALIQQMPIVMFTGEGNEQENCYVLVRSLWGNVQLT